MLRERSTLRLLASSFLLARLPRQLTKKLGQPFLSALGTVALVKKTKVNFQLDSTAGIFIELL